MDLALAPLDLDRFRSPDWALATGGALRIGGGFTASDSCPSALPPTRMFS